MGSAASSSNCNPNTASMIQQEIIKQKQLPLDCSDITDLTEAKNEMRRLRGLCQKLVSSDGSENVAGQSTKNEKKSTSHDEMTLALFREIKLKITERFDNLQDAFLSIDTNRDGFISCQEFKEACWKWCLPVDDTDFNQLNTLYPHQEKEGFVDRGINYLEFVAMMSNVLGYQAGSGEIQPDALHKIFCERVVANGSTMRESFKRLDIDGSGYLDKNEIARVFKANNIHYTDAEFNAFYQQFDVNKDGLFCYSEFVKMFQATQMTN